MLFNAFANVDKAVFLCPLCRLRGAQTPQEKATNVRLHVPAQVEDAFGKRMTAHKVFFRSIVPLPSLL